MSKTTNEKVNTKDVGFFAIIPATVRYDKSVPQGARLLYGEITALMKKKGYCYARNEYFAELYETSERTIIEWISRLRDAGHISVYLDYFPNSKKIHRRYISLPYRPDQELPPELARSHLVVKKSSPPEGLVVKKSSPPEEGLVVKKSSPPDDLVVKESSPPEGLVVKESSPPEGLVVKESSPPSGEENSLVINTNSINTKVVVVDQNPPKTEKPPPETATTAPLAISKESLDKLKLHFAGLDKTLFFDEAFYSKILSFLAEHDLTFDYVSWMYGYCSQNNLKNLNLKNLSGYLFKVLLEPRYVEIYREASRLPPEPPVVAINCPVCGNGYDSTSISCPDCGFKREFRSDERKIKEARILYSMDPDMKMAYEAEFGEFLDEVSSMDFKERSIKGKSIKQKYGLL